MFLSSSLKCVPAHLENDYLPNVIALFKRDAYYLVHSFTEWTHMSWLSVVHSVVVWLKWGCYRIHNIQSTQLLIQLPECWASLKECDGDKNIKPLRHTDCCTLQQEKEKVHTHQLFPPLKLTVSLVGLWDFTMELVL